VDEYLDTPAIVAHNDAFGARFLGDKKGGKKESAAARAVADDSTDSEDTENSTAGGGKGANKGSKKDAKRGSTKDTKRAKRVGTQLIESFMDELMDEMMDIDFMSYSMSFSMSMSMSMPSAPSAPSPSTPTMPSPSDGGVPTLAPVVAVVTPVPTLASSSVAPVVSPAETCASLPRDEALEAILVEVTDGGLLADPVTPQGMAFRWLRDDDPLQIDPCTYATVEQRYALATLYYSASGDTWGTNTGWLSGAAECTWFGVTCGGTEVTSLILGTFF
jgi:hypothetical protein